MGHKSQIDAAWNQKTETYEYDDTFNKVKALFSAYDFVLANLELTLAGPPYCGYPSFSSPKSLAKSARDAGIDVLFTANNHACDTGKKGLRKTIKALDSLHIKHTGTFSHPKYRADKNLLILEKNSIKVGILNYTEHTNFMKTPNATFINRINIKNISQDIQLAKRLNLDKIILMLHWGKEYTSQASKKTQKLAEDIFSKAGVDIIIGTHPHTIQPMHHLKSSDSKRERLIYYSLGNFVSDQRRRYSDGGALAGLILSKANGKTRVKKAGYHLVWVNKYKRHNRFVFEVLPVKDYESNQSIVPPYNKSRINTFINDSRRLLEANNTNVEEW